MMCIVMPETCWANNKICNKKPLLHLVGILFPHTVLYLLRRVSSLHFQVNTSIDKKQSNTTINICIFKRCFYIASLNNDMFRPLYRPLSGCTFSYLKASLSSSSIFHGIWPIVDPFLSRASRSLFNSLPWFLLPVGKYCFMSLGNLLRGIQFTWCIKFLLYSCSLSRIGVIWKQTIQNTMFFVFVNRSRAHL